MASNEQIAYEFFIAKGLTPAQSAGIVGNLMQESGVNPESIQMGGPGRGIAQWSQGGRWQPELMTGNPQQDLINQLNYIWQELEGSEHQSLVMLQSAGDPVSAANIFEQYYERAGIPNNSARDTYASNVFGLAQSGNWGALSTGQMGTAGFNTQTGGNINSAPGNTLNGQPLSMGDIPQVVEWIKQNWASYAWLLNEPGVAAVLEQAAVQGLSTDQVQARIQQTPWWRDTSSAMRTFEQDMALNPADYRFGTPGSKAQSMYSQIANAAGNAGVLLNTVQMQTIAMDALRYGWSTAQIQAAIGSQVYYLRNGQTDAGGIADQLQQQAGQYLQTLSPSVIASWAQNIAAGTQNIQQFDAYMKQNASLKWTGMAAQIAQGYTPNQIIDNLRQEAGKTMEVDPNSINFVTDPFYSKILDYVPPAAPGAKTAVAQPHRLMTLSEMDQYLKTSDQYGFTQGARDSAAQLEQAITQEFGKTG